MNDQKFEIAGIAISEFIPSNTPRVLWEKFHQLNEQLLLEVQPKDSLLDRGIVEKDLMFEFTDYQNYRWFVFSDKSKCELISWYTLRLPNEGSAFANVAKKLGYIEIFIKKDYRRKGLGKMLLKSLAQKANALGCVKLLTRTSDNSGVKFCEKFNGKLINIESENRLYFKDVDWNLVNRWVDEGKTRNPDATIEDYYGVSEEKIDEYCELLVELEMDKPTLEEVEEKQSSENCTPEGYREFVQYMKAKSYTVYTLRTLEKDGHISGLTEIFFSTEKSPKRIEQGLTGVKSVDRGKGLGKWLKAQMLLYIRDNFHNAKYWVTGNANHNDPMLSIKRLWSTTHLIFLNKISNKRIFIYLCFFSQ